MVTFEVILGMTHTQAEAARGAALVRQGQSDFAWGALELAAHTTSVFGTGISYVGYGVAFIPGAQPIAGGLIAAGNTLGTASSVLTATKNFVEGDVGQGLGNLANAGLSSVGFKSVNQVSSISRQGKNILNGGINVKSNIADYMINSYHRN